MAETIASDFLAGLPSWSANGISARRVRDLVVTEIGDVSLVLATDSNASTGNKPGDYLQQDPEITGYSAAKVPLMEVLASGATPYLLVNNLGVDLATTGQSLLRGIRRLLDETAIELMITGSDESNMPTVQTGMGVTILGVAPTGTLRLGSAQAGDVLWVVGNRRSGLPGDEYDEGAGGIATAHHVLDALRMSGVREVLPVGSHGIAFECAELATTAGLRAELRTDTAADLEMSAGASTCFVVACEPGFAPTFADLPTEPIGELRAATTDTATTDTAITDTRSTH